MRWPAILLSFGIACAAEHPLLSEARAAPFEIFADIAFRLLEKNLVEPDDKPALLEELILRSREAVAPLPVRLWPASARGRAEWVNRSQPLALDGLSIRTRALRALLALDAAKARRLFEDLPPPQTIRHSCSDPLIHNPAPYFESLAAVIELAPFTPEERRKNEPLHLAMRAIRSITSVPGLVAAANVYSRLLARGLDEPALNAALAATAAQINDSDPGFSVALSSLALIERLHMIPDARRALLVRHLTAVRCSSGIVAGPLLRGIEPPLTSEELTPAKVERPTPQPGVSNEIEFLQLEAEVDSLARRSPEQSKESLSTIRLTADWELRARSIAMKIEDWKGPDDQDPIELFHQKCRLWYRLVDLAPGGELHRRAMHSFLRTLADPRVRREAPAEWRTQLQQLLTLQQVFSPALVASLRTAGALPPGSPFESGREIESAMLASGDPVLSLYARLP